VVYHLFDRLAFFFDDFPDVFGSQFLGFVIWWLLPRFRLGRSFVPWTFSDQYTLTCYSLQGLPRSHHSTYKPESLKMAHHLDGTEVNPLLNIDILHNIFAQIPAVDSDTSARMTEVCRHWWTVGHRYVWGQSFNQLRGLVLHVNDPARRAYFASQVKHIHIEPADDTLTDDQNILSELEFPRLESISLYLSNIKEMKSENIEALMVPSLRSFTLNVCDLKWRDDSE
jgi:hypothetical protein